MYSLLLSSIKYLANLITESFSFNPHGNFYKILIISYKLYSLLTNTSFVKSSINFPFNINPNFNYLTISVISLILIPNTFYPITKLILLLL